MINLLSISTRFDFERLRELVIDAIDKLKWHPVLRITLAEKYNVDPWLRPAYMALCHRPDPLEAEEAKQLGFEKTVLIAKAREKRIHMRYVDWEALGRIVDEIFFPQTQDDTNT
jgi:hypothetical protein